jgi:hypothetical protein
MAYEGKFYGGRLEFFKIARERCTNGFLVFHRINSTGRWIEFQTRQRRAWFKELNRAKEFIRFVNDNPRATNEEIDSFIGD